jgi:hypothetical protein
MFRTLIPTPTPRFIDKWYQFSSKVAECFIDRKGFIPFPHYFIHKRKRIDICSVFGRCVVTNVVFRVLLN